MRTIQLTMNGQRLRLLDYNTPSFIKWAGGKSQLLKQLSPFIPDSFNRYFEPFIGGGSFAFFILKNYSPKEIYLSDVNEELINTYINVRDNVKELLFKLEIMKAKHSKEFYYKIRSLDTKSLNNLDRAARFIYLNKTCFNGLYRVNSKGLFNVPMGSYKNPSIIVQNKLEEASELLKKTTIKTINFEQAIINAQEDDFVYFDPPYHPLDNRKSFTTYTKGNFLEKEQIRLSDVFRELAERGCKLMLSNSDTNFIKNLYSKFELNIVKANRMINSNASKRGKINELVITNF